ncbi:uncharacterized protein LOC143053945 isoform X1 [Mytilus galloprovincialis]|uniref:uncharacterized protein LOC143053945 isoform X1 n=1 Tax=Mytilus galloprovincialis TaxID=29158 RepID=UPI003F7C2F29
MTTEFYFGLAFAVILALCTGANNAANLCGVVYGIKSMSFRKIYVILFLTRIIGVIIMSFQLSELKTSSTMASSCVEYNLTNVDLMEKGIVVIAGSSVWLLVCTLQGVPVSLTSSIIGAELGYLVTKNGIKNINWPHFVKTYIVLGSIGLIFLTFFTTIVTYHIFSKTVYGVQQLTKNKREYQWWISYLLEFTVLSAMFVFITYTPSSLINFEKQPLYNILPPMGRVILGLLIFFVWQKSRKLMMKGKGLYSRFIISFITRCFTFQQINICTGSCKGNCDSFKTSESLLEVDDERVTQNKKEKSCSLNVCVINMYCSCNQYIMQHSKLKQTNTEREEQSGSSNQGQNDTENNGIKTGCDGLSTTKDESIRVRQWFIRLTQTVVVFSCIAYGGHDVSNAVGSVFVMIKLTNQSELIRDERVAIVVLLLVFIVISLGVWYFGQIVMKSVKKLARFNDNAIDGFCVEMSAVFTIFTYSHLFMVPVSITYCKVVAMAAVGIVNKRFNWSLFKKILICWLLTIPVTGLISGLILKIMF